MSLSFSFLSASRLLCLTLSPSSPSLPALRSFAVSQAQVAYFRAFLSPHSLMSVAAPASRSTDARRAADRLAPLHLKHNNDIVFFVSARNEAARASGGRGMRQRRKTAWVGQARSEARLPQCCCPASLFAPCCRPAFTPSPALQQPMPVASSLTASASPSAACAALSLASPLVVSQSHVRVDPRWLLLRHSRTH